MIPSIAEYDAKRLRKRARRVEKSWVVYIVTIEGSESIKVGRTGNLAARMQSYRSSERGTARCLAQMEVSKLDDAKNLERHVVDMLAEKRVAGREWFIMPHEEVMKVVEAIRAAPPVPVIIRGGHGRNEFHHSEFKNESRLGSAHNRRTFSSAAAAR